MLKKYWYKLLAPVLITILVFIFCIYEIVMGLFTSAFLSEWWPLVICLIFGGGCCVSAFVLWERFKEIESGEEDDLSKY